MRLAGRENAVTTQLQLQLGQPKRCGPLRKELASSAASLAGYARPSDTWLAHDAGLWAGMLCESPIQDANPWEAVVLSVLSRKES